MVTESERLKEVWDRSGRFNHDNITLVEISTLCAGVVERGAINNEIITHLGNEYYPVQISLKFPDSTGTNDSIEFAISNVNLMVGRRILSTSQSLHVRIFAVNHFNNDVVLMDTGDILKLEGARIGWQKVTGTLKSRFDLQVRIPVVSHTKQTIPGAFL